MTSCTIIGKFQTPDGQPMSGEVLLLSPSPGWYIPPEDSITVGTAVSIILAYDGTIKGIDGFNSSPGLVIQATDDPGVNPQNFTWRIGFQRATLDRIIPAFSFAAPGGTVVDLKTAIPIPDANGTYVTRGDPGIAIFPHGTLQPPGGFPPCIFAVLNS